jgi:hypothetical protein
MFLVTIACDARHVAEKQTWECPKNKQKTKERGRPNSQDGLFLVIDTQRQ